MHLQKNLVDKITLAKNYEIREDEILKYHFKVDAHRRNTLQFHIETLESDYSDSLV